MHRKYKIITLEASSMDLGSALLAVVKCVSDSTEPDGLVRTRLGLFTDPPVQGFYNNARATAKATKALSKKIAQRPVLHALRTRNESDVSEIHKISPDIQVLVYHKHKAE